MENWQNGKVNSKHLSFGIQAGHSVRVRPNPIPNLEVKPDVAIVLLRCESSWEAIVLAPFVIWHIEMMLPGSG